MKQRRVTRLEGLAYHEAGHAVVACVSDIPFHYVTITASSDGHVELAGWPLWADASVRLYAERDVMVTFAGEVARRKLLGNGTRHPDVNGFASDDADVRKAARRFGGRRPATTRAWCQWLYLRTREIVDEHWSEIEAVAGALLERRRLTDNEVKTIMSAAKSSEREPHVRPSQVKSRKEDHRRAVKQHMRRRAAPG